MPKALCELWVLHTNHFQNQGGFITLYIILQITTNERNILKDSHKSSDTSMLEFLKSKYTASGHD